MVTLRLPVTVGVLALVNLAIMVAFRNTTNWRLGRYIVWWSPALLIVLAIATVVAVRPWRWRATAIVACIMVALTVNAFVIRNTGGSTPCVRPFTHQGESC